MIGWNGHSVWTIRALAYASSLHVVRHVKEQQGRWFQPHEIGRMDDDLCAACSAAPAVAAWPRVVSTHTQAHLSSACACRRIYALSARDRAGGAFVVFGRIA